MSMPEWYKINYKRETNCILSNELINGHAECIVEPDAAYEQTIQDILKHFREESVK